MTAAEVISLALSRNVSSDHIKDSDITVSQRKYVDGYISGYSEASTFFINYCKPVIAYGCVVDVFERFSTEITDRGVVGMTTPGAVVLDVESRARTKDEFSSVLRTLIDIMVEEAATVSGVTILDDELDYEAAIYLGTTKRGRL